MGLDGWTEDFDRALAMARTTDPVSQATLVAHEYVGLSRGVLLAELRDMCATQRYALNAVSLL
jgi:hypothetical protein